MNTFIKIIQLTTIAMNTNNIKPDISEFSFLTGTWECNVWGGTFEEVWNAPKANSITNMGRHFKNGTMSFMEFGSIELDADSKWNLHMIFGKLGEGEKKPTSFELESFKKGEVIFVNKQNDFPTHIKYSSVNKNSMTCVIYGRADGKEEKEIFNFKKSK